jgi:polyisoprenoid-binding protein YceI
MKTLQSTAIIAVWLLNVASCSPGDSASTAAAPEAAPVETAATPAPAAPDVSKLPAGDYKLDPLHASLIFQVNHLGFSNYTGQFRTFTADMTLDPARPEKAKLIATVDLKSLDIPASPADFIAELLSDQWLGASKTPQMKYESTSITKTGPATADILGNLTLNGVTRPVTLHATFNGGYEGHSQDPNARIGFSARGALNRSDFGIAYGIPAPGSTMGVSDEVTIEIETEFSGPALEKDE